MPSAPSGYLNSPPPPNEPRLESWGEIAAFLKRDIRTAQRWEKHFGLPVRRLMIGKQGQVYAYRSELDRWMQERQPKPEDDQVAREDENGSDASRTSATQDNKASGSESASNDSRQNPPPGPRTWKRLAIAGAVVIVVLAAAAVYHALPPIPNNNRADKEKAFLFVRPFASESDEPQERAFVSGLTDDLITHLGRMDPERLVVFAPTTSKELGSKSIQELRSILNADFVLEGSVRRDQNQLRVEAALISAVDLKARWTKAYTDLPGNVLKFQDEVSDDVANEIRTVIPNIANPVRNVASRTVDPAVYDAYLAGRLYWQDRDLGRSLLAYQRALRLDPHYAPALAGLASTYILLGQSPNDVLTAGEAIPKARDAAEQALAIDSTLGDATSVLANIAMSYDHNLAEAKRLFQKAIADDPSNVTAHIWYGHYLMVTSQMSEGDVQIKQALQIDPASPLTNSAAAEFKYLQRDYDGAIQQAKLTLENHNGFIYAVFWLGSAYREKGMYREALEQFDLARRLSKNNPAMLWAYGHCLGVSGDRAGAQAVLRELQTLRQSRYVPALYIAGMYQALGDRDKTFEWLDLAYTENNDWLIHLAVDPLADPLRSDPRFPILMRRLGLP